MKYFSHLENFLMTHKKNVGKFLFIGLTFWALLLLNNRLQFRIVECHVDEELTINLGINSMYTGKVENLRVGESTRWLARMVYPIGLFYMNSNMGRALCNRLGLSKRKLYTKEFSPTCRCIRGSKYSGPGICHEIYIRRFSYFVLFTGIVYDQYTLWLYCRPVLFLFCTKFFTG